MYGMARFITSQRRFCRTCMALICVSAAMCVISAASEVASAPVVLFYDAQVFTAEYDHPYAEAVAIRGDRIIAVGTLEAVERIVGRLRVRSICTVIS